MIEEEYPFPDEVSRFKNPLDYNCPICGLYGDFIFEDYEITEWGLNISDYPDGICVSCVKDEGTQSYIFDDETGTIKPGKLVKLNLSEDELERRKMSVKQGYNNSRFIEKIRTKFSNEINQEIRSNLEPPYSFENMKYWSSRSGLDDETKELRIEEIMNKTYVEFPNHWLKNLEESIFEFEMNISCGNFSRSRSPTRISYSLICTYLHKSVTFNDIEPVWTFFKRTNLPYKDFEVGINRWHSPLSNSNSRLIDACAEIVPNERSLLSLLSIIKNHSTSLYLTDEEFTEIKETSLKILSELGERKIESTGYSYLEKLCEKLSFDQLSICDAPFPVIGLIEALCVKTASNKVFNSKGKARSLNNYFLFPISNNKFDWEDKLSDNTITCINVFERLVEQLIV